MLTKHTLDLQDAAAPEDVAIILRNAAQAYRESQGALQSAWQDREAGRPWQTVAARLERLADQLDKVL